MTADKISYLIIISILFSQIFLTLYIAHKEKDATLMVATIIPSLIIAFLCSMVIVVIFRDCL